MSETSQPSASPAKAAEDLAFLRDLAEAARQTPFGGGDYLIAAGGWFALASLVGGAGSLWPCTALGAFCVSNLRARLRGDARLSAAPRPRAR